MYFLFYKVRYNLFSVALLVSSVFSLKQKTEYELRISDWISDVCSSDLIWIPIKHTGENEGAGTVPWDGTQQARFRKGDAGLNLLDFGKANNWFTEEDLTDRAAFPISTLNRLLGDPAIRTALGLELSAGKLQSTVAISDLEKGIKQVVSDLATGTWNVSMLKSKQDRKKYLDQFPAARTEE